MFICDARSIKENMVSADLRINMDKKLINMTGVYGPASGTNKEGFLQ
jgi:hypothetical protein